MAAIDFNQLLTGLFGQGQGGWGVQQQTADPQQQLPPELGAEGNPIVVGRPTRDEPVYSDPGGPEAPNLGNSNILEEAQSVRESAPERSGMFGMKGTLRDVLGTVGDAFLVQSGNKPLYQQRRQQEGVADAMAGFGQDPMAAMERLASLPGGAEMAQALNQQYQKQMNDYMTQRGNAAKEQREVRDDELTHYQKFGQQFANFMGAATPETWEKMKPILQTMKDKGQLGDEYMIPDEYDPDYAAAIQMGGMPTSRQVSTVQRDRSLDQGDRRLDQGDYRNETGRISANRPRAASNPTEASELATIRDKVDRGERLAPGEAATWQRYIEGGSGERRRTPPPPPASGNSRFRIIRD